MIAKANSDGREKEAKLGERDCARWNNEKGSITVGPLLAPDLL